jgi:ABC-type multidrug transport system permease subunit
MAVAELLFASATTNRNTSALVAGNFMMAVALFVIFYGITTFYRRLYLMTNAKPYGYGDALGPAVFAAFIITGV